MSASHLVCKILGTTSVEKLGGDLSSSELSQDQIASLQKLADCRLARMPVQYIVGDWDFREITIKTQPPVFIPRPETEELVGHILNHLSSLEQSGTYHVNVVEVGCGSGAICLSLLRECRLRLRILAVDQSSSACELTDDNARSLGLRDNLTIVNAKVSNDSEDFGFEGMLGDSTLDVVVSNPPYVLRKDMAHLLPEIKLYEDLRALDGGKEGLDVIEPILKASEKFLKTDGLLFLEVDPCHPYLIPNVLKEASLQRLKVKSVLKDFCGRERFVIVQKSQQEVHS